MKPRGPAYIVHSPRPMSADEAARIAATWESLYSAPMLLLAPGFRVEVLARRGPIGSRPANVCKGYFRR